MPPLVQRPPTGMRGALRCPQRCRHPRPRLSIPPMRRSPNMLTVACLLTRRQNPRTVSDPTRGHGHAVTTMQVQQ